jgi:hypothetical protein
MVCYFWNRVFHTLHPVFLYRVLKITTELYLCSTINILLV